MRSRVELFEAIRRDHRLSPAVRFASSRTGTGFIVTRARPEGPTGEVVAPVRVSGRGALSATPFVGQTLLTRAAHPPGVGFGVGRRKGKVWCILDVRPGCAGAILCLGAIVAVLQVAVVGAGYWGPNLVRNFRASPNWDLVAVCDLDDERARKAVGDRSTVEVERSVERLLLRDDVDAIAIATPAASHKDIALHAIAAGKHLLVEKPLATSRADAQELVDAASAAGVVLMCDHTYCHTPVVRKITQLVSNGALGDIHFVDSVRINLGLVQPDVDVIWDLAPHDLSILDTILPGSLMPEGVAAHGADPIGAGKACVGYLTMPLGSGAIAHIHVNWLSPTKIRHMVIGGSLRTLVWDDLNPQQRLSLYDRGVELEQTVPGLDPEGRRNAVVSYRLGDMHAPTIPEREALGLMVEEFANAIREERAPLTDGAAGVRVLSVLEAASASLSNGGVLMPVPAYQASSAALIAGGAHV